MLPVELHHGIVDPFKVLKRGTDGSLRTFAIVEFEKHHCNPGVEIDQPCRTLLSCQHFCRLAKKPVRLLGFALPSPALYP